MPILTTAVHSADHNGESIMNRSLSLLGLSAIALAVAAQPAMARAQVATETSQASWVDAAPDIHASPASQGNTDEIHVCPQLYRHSCAVSLRLTWAIVNAPSFAGWGQSCNPNIPGEPGWNDTARSLTLHDLGKPYHPLFNTFEWKCGCP
jgi:hypothetical protein